MFLIFVMKSGCNVCLTFYQTTLFVLIKVVVCQPCSGIFSHRPWCLEETSCSLVESLSIIVCRLRLILFCRRRTTGNSQTENFFVASYPVTSNRDYISPFSSRERSRRVERRRALFDTVSKERTIRLRKRVKRSRFFGYQGFRRSAEINRLSRRRASAEVEQPSESRSVRETRSDKSNAEIPKRSPSPSLRDYEFV